MAARRGHRSDTKELHINLKTILLGRLRLSASLRELTVEQQQIMNNYESQSPSFKSLWYLFHGDPRKCTPVPSQTPSRRVTATLRVEAPSGTVY